MKKTRSIKNFALIGFIALIGLVFTVLSFDIPFSSNTYVGFARAIPLGKDLAGGVVATYEVVTPEDYEGNYFEQLEKTKESFAKILNEGFGQTSVILLNDEYIRVEAANVKSVASALGIVDKTGLIEFKTENSASAAARITSKDIKKIEYSFSGGTHGMLINFNETGTTLFENLTSELAAESGSMYIFVNNELFSGEGGLKVEQTIYGGTTFLASSDEVSARGTVLKLNASLNEVQLNLQDSVQVYFGVFGEHTTIYLAIIAIVLVAVVFGLLFAFYNGLGLVGMLSLVLSLVISFVFYALIPNVYLTLTTYLTMIFGFEIAVVTMVYIFEKIKQELIAGKKQPVAVKHAYKSLVPALLDIHIPLFVATLIMAWIGGNVTLSGFAVIMMIGLGINAVFSLFVLRFFVYNLIPLTKNKLDKFGIKGGC